MPENAGPEFSIERAVRIGSIAAALGGLVFGLIAMWMDRDDLARLLWTAGVAPVLLVLIVEIVRSLRRGRLGLDLVAALSMSSAILVGETLAAAVVGVMYAGGQALEAFAQARAGREMNALLARVPRTAALHVDGRIETIPIAAIRPGDRLLVLRGDVLPVDGVVLDVRALIDEAAVTGESLPVRKAAGEMALSGTLNVGEAFDLEARETADRSTYAGIVKLVEAATRSEAPATRLADRWALGFTALAILGALTAWILSGDPRRAVAVLVVATPCPLILAVPVAIVAGISRAARRGILVKGGAALETLGRLRTLVIDKTGTLTHGSVAVAEVRTTPSFAADEVLMLAASLDQASRHVVAQALVEDAKARGLVLQDPSGTVETPGEGVEGVVRGRVIRVGGPSYAFAGLDPEVLSGLMADVAPGTQAVGLRVDDQPAGLVLVRDGLRRDVRPTLAALRAMGIARIVLATGDRRPVAEAVADGLGLDAVEAELSPEGKIDLVRRERKAAPVMMVGDGVNDAPALVEADLGVAMGARGAAASAEAADVVLLRDSLDGLVDAIAIARRSRAIALQSVVAGVGLSALGMLAAGLGHLPPVQGALFQEAIDVAVILNALRALGGGITPGRDSPSGSP